VKVARNIVNKAMAQKKTVAAFAPEVLSAKKEAFLDRKGSMVWGQVKLRNSSHGIAR
jgi:hypothetical protein